MKMLNKLIRFINGEAKAERRKKANMQLNAHYLQQREYWDNFIVEQNKAKREEDKAKGIKASQNKAKQVQVAKDKAEQNILEKLPYPKLGPHKAKTQAIRNRVEEIQQIKQLTPEELKAQQLKAEREKANQVERQRLRQLEVDNLRKERIKRERIDSLAERYKVSREQILAESCYSPKKSKYDIVSDYICRFDSEYIQRSIANNGLVFISDVGYSPIGYYMKSVYFHCPEMKNASVTSLQTVMYYFNAVSIDKLLKEEYRGHTLEFWLDLEDLHYYGHYWETYNNNGKVFHRLSKEGNEYLGVIDKKWLNYN